MAGAGSNSTAESLNLMRFAAEVGADAALVVTPYYNKPTQAGLIAHYTALNDVGLPIFIYNIPSRSVVRWLIGILMRVATGWLPLARLANPPRFRIMNTNRLSKSSWSTRQGESLLWRARALIALPNR